MARPRWSRSISSSRRFLGLVGAATTLCISVPASAGVEPIALRYETTAGCPTESEFMAWVRSHTKRWTHVPDETPGVRTIRVHVSAGNAEATGLLTVTSVDGAVTERKIEGPTCAEVSEAVAVMVAVAIDPRAGADVDSGEDSPRAGDEEAGEPRAGAGPAPPPRRAPPRASPPARTSPGGSRPNDGPHVSFDLRAETTSAVIRGGLPGIGASITVEPRAPARRRGLQVSEPSLGAGIRQSFPKERSLRGGSAELSWTTGHLRLCPLRVVIEGLAEVSPCAEANIGVLGVSARGFAEARGLSTFWFDIGASVWATVSLSERIFLSATASWTMPLFRQPFALASGVPVASVPPLGVLGGLGLGLRM